MKIALLSDTRVPTVPYGGHGLGRMCLDLANGLRESGHRVTLFAGHGSQWTGDVVTYADEDERAQDFATPDSHLWMYDAVLDLSHNHTLSKLCPGKPVVNWIVDTECQYTPPNAVVGNRWQQKAFPSARIVPLGIKTAGIPVWIGERTRLGYCAKVHYLKGYDIALEVAQRTRLPIAFAGQLFTNASLPDYRGVIENDAALYEFLGQSIALLSPCRKDAGGRVNLEAAACGTPVLCLAGTGTADHVEHGVSGFICRDVHEMVDAVQDIGLLDAEHMRDWVESTHGIGNMVSGTLDCLNAVRDGERW